MKRSKWAIQDRVGGKIYSFVPKRTKTMFDEKIPTWKQFFEDIKHTGNINIIYKNKVIAKRGL